MASQNGSDSPFRAARIANKQNARLVVIIVVLMVIPFLLLASPVESLVRTWSQRPTTPFAAWVMVAGLLWADILLPIPSSVVTTFAGAKLGWFQAFLASDAGMMLGSLTAFALGRFATITPLAKLTHEQANLAAASTQKWGTWTIVVTRGIPLVAEVVLIYVAAQRIPFRTFLWATLASNTAISLGYALLGHWAADREWLAIVLGASGVLPLLLGFAVRRWLISSFTTGSSVAEKR